MKLRKISVVTVTYNSVKTLERTILSVLQQNYPLLEYIIIDGGSTDGTIEVIQKYELQLAYWITETDKGIADAWNKGIRQSTGDIVHLLNSDDWHAEQTIKYAVDFLNDHPQYGFVFGNLLVHEMGTNQVRFIGGDPAYLNRIRFSFPRVPHPTIFMQRRIYEQFGAYNASFQIATDYELLLRITMMEIRGGYASKLICYMGSGGLSQRKFYRAHVEVMEISIMYGYDRWKAYLRFAANVFQSSIVKGLIRMGLFRLVSIIRDAKGRLLSTGTVTRDDK